MQVFADHDSSLNPLDVPRSWLWKLNRRTVYFGTSIPTIFKGKDGKTLHFYIFTNDSNNSTQYMFLLARVINTRNSAMLLERYEKMSLIYFCVIVVALIFFPKKSFNVEFIH